METSASTTSTGRISIGRPTHTWYAPNAKSWRVLEKLASARKVALLGYEIGAHVDSNENKVPVQNQQVEKHNDEIMILWS